MYIGLTLLLSIILIALAACATNFSVTFFCIVPGIVGLIFSLAYLSKNTLRK